MNFNRVLPKICKIYCLWEIKKIHDDVSVKDIFQLQEIVSNIFKILALNTVLNNV